MNIQFSGEEKGSINFIWVDINDFTKLVNTKLGRTFDNSSFWTLVFQIGKVDLTVFCNKEKCQMCKEAFVDDWTVDLCGDCFELFEQEEAEERARMKREDRYDESRGH